MTRAPNENGPVEGIRDLTGRTKAPTVHAHLRTPASGHVHDETSGVPVFNAQPPAPEGESQHRHGIAGDKFSDSGHVVRWDIIPEPTFRRFEVIHDRIGGYAVMEWDERGRPTIAVAAGLTKTRANEMSQLLNGTFREGALWRAVQMPRKRRSVYGGAIRCAKCQLDGIGNEYGDDYAGDDFIEWPRSLDNFDYECARCHAHTHPYTETGVSR